MLTLCGKNCDLYAVTTAFFERRTCDKGVSSIPAGGADEIHGPRTGMNA